VRLSAVEKKRLIELRIHRIIAEKDIVIAAADLLKTYKIGDHYNLELIEFLIANNTSPPINLEIVLATKDDSLIAAFLRESILSERWLSNAEDVCRLMDAAKVRPIVTKCLALYKHLYIHNYTEDLIIEQKYLCQDGFYEGVKRPVVIDEVMQQELIATKQKLQTVTKNLEQTEKQLEVAQRELIQRPVVSVSAASSTVSANSTFTSAPPAPGAPPPPPPPAPGAPPPPPPPPKLALKATAVVSGSLADQLANKKLNEVTENGKESKPNTDGMTETFNMIKNGGFKLRSASDAANAHDSKPKPEATKIKLSPAEELALKFKKKGNGDVKIQLGLKPASQRKVNEKPISPPLPSLKKTEIPIDPKIKAANEGRQTFFATINNLQKDKILKAPKLIIDEYEINKELVVIIRENLFDNSRGWSEFSRVLTECFRSQIKNSAQIGNLFNLSMLDRAMSNRRGAVEDDSDSDFDEDKLQDLKKYFKAEFSADKFAALCKNLVKEAEKYAKKIEEKSASTISMKLSHDSEL